MSITQAAYVDNSYATVRRAVNSREKTAQRAGRSTVDNSQLPQFATLKAIGYRDRSLDGTVITISLLIVIVAFVPALAAALGLYSVIRDQTLLPVAMTWPRLAAVFVATLVMASISALLSLGSLRRADPVELF